MSVLCPYCKSELSPPPRRMKACPKCGNNVYVRSTQDLLQGMHFTLETAMAIDTYNESLLGKEFIKSNYARHERILKERKGKNPRPVSVVWEILKDASNQDYKIYYEMAILLGKIGKDPNPALERHSRGELLELKYKGVISVEILSSDNGCDECINQRKKYTIDEALQLMPLPNRRCTFDLFFEEYPFCRCSYLPILEQ